VSPFFSFISYIRFDPCSFAVLLVFLFLVGGCQKKPEPGPKPPQVNWSWDTYPSAEKMRLATVPCQILPRPSLAINAPVAGK